jgi:hypothetical protein
MNLRLIPPIIALTLLGFLPVAFAQVAPGRNDNARFGAPRPGNPTAAVRPYQDYLYGVIKSVAKGEIVLDKTKFGIDQTIKLVPKTKFIRDGKLSRPEDLKIGEDVFVETKKDKKTGEMVAKKIVTGAAVTPPN